MKSSDLLTIGRLAARFGLATHVLRFWEEQGLLLPDERVSGRRLYDADHASARITMILRGKDMGLSLAEIGRLLSTPPDTHVEQLREHRAALDAQIERLEAAKALIDHAIDCHAPELTRCPEFQDVARAASPVS
ncbi:MAG: hypothetical protein AVDCRST_MAG85-3961 [uncultured Solirubrobacteraceae bacterium]|uniref:HTH merR-type domain-containing protein n=1 Tax=uncultured Solirubrobacteraceae bacterium TaxID=1162706 RepID=A0A6J4TWW4_9ACTN|nr:MAG: hypothetical protein AVDCRST_MAG85-3961 [uncultured Solirubrobacteraceae bacterium]